LRLIRLATKRNRDRNQENRDKKNSHNEYLEQI
jgi:hypothetical protein